MNNLTRNHFKHKNLVSLSLSAPQAHEPPAQKTAISAIPPVDPNRTDKLKVTFHPLV